MLSLLMLLHCTSVFYVSLVYPSVFVFCIKLFTYLLLSSLWGKATERQRRDHWLAQCAKRSRLSGKNYIVIKSVMLK